MAKTDVFQYIGEMVPQDTWADARMFEVINYLYGNKKLRLTESQRTKLKLFANASERES